MIPKMRGKKAAASQIEELQAAAGMVIPACYSDFVQTRGCGTPDPGYVRRPEKYGTRFVPNGLLRIDRFVTPAKSRLVRTETDPVRTFLAFAVRDDYFFLLELTSNSEQGVYFWALHRGETLDDSFARTDKSIGMVSYIVRVADDFDQFIQSFEGLPLSTAEDE